MKIILAFDSFKGSLTSFEAVEAAKNGVLSIFPDAEIITLPLADGGEGTMQVLSRLMNAQIVSCQAVDPLMRIITAHYAISADFETAFMDVASTVGLTLLRENERSAMNTTTLGIGNLIFDAIFRGVRHIIIGIGGSATNDCGVGMLATLGVPIYDSEGLILVPKGGNLLKIGAYDTSKLQYLHELKITALCDVDNPLFGKNGAAYVYAKQKGASDDDVKMLDDGLRHFASLVGLDANVPGAGAGGGLGYAFMILGATLQSGADFILDAAKLDQHLHGADLVLTGEGKIDTQTLNGKLPYKVLTHAEKQNVPVVAFAGRVENTDQLTQAGFCSVRSINPNGSNEQDAFNPEVAKRNLTNAVATYLNELSLKNK